MNIKTLSDTEKVLLGEIAFRFLPLEEDLDKENEFLEAFEVVFNQTLTVTDALGVIEYLNRFRRVETADRNLLKETKLAIESLLEVAETSNIEDVKFFYNVLEVEGKTCNDIVESAKA